MMVSFVLSFFPRDVLDEILNLIESVSEDFPSYSWITHSERWKRDEATPIVNKNNKLCIVTRVLQDVNDTETSLNFKIECIMDKVACINPKIMYKVPCIKIKMKKKTNISRGV